MYPTAPLCPTLMQTEATIIAWMLALQPINTHLILLAFALRFAPKDSSWTTAQKNANPLVIWVSLKPQADIAWLNVLATPRLLHISAIALVSTNAKHPHRIYMPTIVHTSA